MIGSGPAGLACAQQLTRAGHLVTVYERADRIGGLLRYGIPEFRLEKRYLDRRLEQMCAEGTQFRAGVAVGTDLDAAELRRRSDAVVVATGATVPRELPVPGRELAGIHQAMEYLPAANHACAGDAAGGGARRCGLRCGQAVPPVSADGLHVIIVGGGDTGADCLGTALRQGAASVIQLDINPLPARTGPRASRGRCTRSPSVSPPPTRRPASSPGWPVRTGTTGSARSPGPTVTCGCSPRSRSASRRAPAAGSGRCGWPGPN